MVLYISVILVLMFSLLFLILFSPPFFLFLANVAKVLSILFVFLKKSPNLIDLFCCPFSLHFICFHSDLSSFLLQSLDLICFSFISSLGCQVRLLI